MIIDTHVHIGDMLNFVLTKEDVIASMERFGIDHSIVSSLNAAEFDHMLRPVPPKYQHSQLECLEDVISFAKEYPSKISAAVWVRPYNEKADYDLYKAINDNRRYIKAIKFHPYHSNLPFDGKESEPFIELAQHYGLPVVVHTGGCDAASCVRVYNAARRFPKTRFVMVHMGLGTDNSEAIELISRLPNLYGDTTWVPVASTLKLIEKAGIEKIMFGSDNPIDGPETYLHNRTGDRSLYQQYFNELKDIISPEYYDRLMYRNAAEFFGIHI
ncbi:MAG: amidohydrolase family protein [Clostridia bacterium]|nr:amidohydrolase family protein [Clostridia bacterium]